AWVPFRFRGDDESSAFDQDQIGYAKVNGKWGIALRRVWGSEDQATFNIDGPWLFNDAPRDVRLSSVDGILKVLEALFTEAVDTAKKIEQKIKAVRDLTQAVNAGKADELASLKILASERPGGSK
ncbi:MAG: hypothetical protein ACRD37_06515, partial [Candidatus Acidiferrales bacterium]